MADQTTHRAEHTPAREAKLTIIYDDVERVEGGKGLGAKVERLVRKIGELETEKFAETLSSFCRQIGASLEGVTTAVKDYELQTFEVTVDVTAKGEIRLIGGVGSELKGGIKLVFRRSGP